VVVNLCGRRRRTLDPSARHVPTVGGEPGVLLLRNGQVIEGQIERNGDYYTVTLPDQELANPGGDRRVLLP